MLKEEFIVELRKGLDGLPTEDIEERAAFYCEMIDDRIEEGLSEDEAVAEMGNVCDVVAQIIADTPITKIVKEKIKPKRRLEAWEIALIAVGSPIWISLAAALFSVVISVYAAVWSIIVSLWAVAVSLVGSAVGGVVLGTCMTVLGNRFAGLSLLGAGLFIGGLSIFAVWGCKAATKGGAVLTKKLTLGVKNLFLRGGRAE